ncbi:MAG: hypothetical protein GWP08_05790 [Nitrospiraceae bacterium]|nr:hypothetical protein [Nitrospiraceae bacterium]
MTESVTLFCFGKELELAPATVPCHSHAQRPNNCEVYRRVCEVIRNSPTPCLVGDIGIFTAYGRLYLESMGDHVEVALAPGTSPDEAVKTDAKMIKILQDALRAIRGRLPGVNLLKNNRDYMSGATWGAHESYAIRKSSDSLAEAVLPFLVTRQIFAGSGTPQRGGYWLSPRAAYMKQAIGGDTTGNRAIYSTARDEPLMERRTFRHRLHLIVGDSNRSQLSQWLKLGTTALVLRAAEENPRIGDAVRFSQPVSSIQALSKLDPDGALLFNPLLTAVQRHYLAAVGNLLEKHDMPKWCARVWQVWSDTLDRLESDPRETQLDAFIKLKLFQHFLNSRGKKWQDLNTCVDGLFWDLALLDVHYHALLDSAFDSLDEAGVIDHRVVPDAETEPGCEPEPFVLSDLPREAARSRLIKQYAGSAGYACGWTHFSNVATGETIKMMDPFSGNMEWEAPAARRRTDPRIARDSENVTLEDLHARIRSEAYARRAASRERSAVELAALARARAAFERRRRAQDRAVDEDMPETPEQTDLFGSGDSA